MTVLERTAVTALPWLSATGAVAMTGITVVKWNDLSPADRAALGLDALAYAVAAPPLARCHPAGWWTLCFATLVQPVFAVIDVAQAPPRWSAASAPIPGRTRRSAARPVQR